MQKILNFREYFLNPKGIKIVPTSNFKRATPIERFFDQSVVLHRAEKQLEKNVVAFKLQPYKYSLNKPEIKQYFTKLYGLNVDKVNTINYMGAIKRSPKGGRYREKDFKKVYLQLNEEIEPFFQKIEK
ncbi:unnamed protein product [Paramecium primaurelia]|uniref:Ribosomal protein L23 n=1 Tax=Paramecium primaurelia TaxID=5886 RepID=A0A8S1PSN2_PARPR|nr:unnamed protein product [Paramecium primaurelia]